MAKNENYYDYDSANIAKSLQKAMSNNADASVVKYLNDVRKKKIKDGGAEMAQYRDDNLTRAADEYVESFDKTNVEKVNEARREAQKNSLRRAYENIYKNYETAAESIEQSGSEARRNIAAKSQKDRFDTENMLATLGLGRGAYEKSSSGASESARVKLISDAAEKIMQTYKDEQAQTANAAQTAANAAAKVEEEYMKNNNDAYSQLESDMIERDDNFQKNRLDMMQLASDNRHDERDFDYKTETDRRDFEYTKQKDEYEKESKLREEQENKAQREFDNAMSTFEMTGVITTSEQSRILGLPIGTKSEFMENLTYQKTVNSAQIANEAQQSEFDRNYTMFRDVGSVITSEQARVLGVPVGTKYWQYVESMIRANAAATSANASVMSAQASQTNAAANYKDAQTNVQKAKISEQNAKVNAAQVQMQNRKIEEEILTSKQKREANEKMYDY